MQRTLPSRARSLTRLSQNSSKKQSTLFDGASIGKQLQKSSFGHFHAALQDLQSYLPMLTFKLPRVIVLGGKNAGKSSLLENITKCPVFPRNAGLCTKMPVRLQLCHVNTEAECSVSIVWQGVSTQLQSRDSILAEVEAIMHKVDTVIADELTIKICQVDVPTFELIDLPGIQLLPEAQAKLTHRLAEKYLKQKDTLVLCVVDATIASLTDSKALTMVHAAGKLDSTIVALTKSDLIRNDSEIIRFFGRVLRDSSEDADNQLLDDLAGCVAVANRNHRDHLSLVEAEVEEQRIFGEMLAASADAEAAPEDYQLLVENLGIKQLIVQLDKLFHNFIVQKWKPAALDYLGPLREEVGDHIDHLGPAVEALSKDGLLENICDMVDYDKDICAVIAASVIHVTRRKTLKDLFIDLTVKEWGTLAWAESTIKIEAKVTSAVKDALDTRGDRYLAPVTTAFEAVFAKDTPLKLSRFSALREVLVTDVLSKRVSEAKKAAARTVDRMLKDALMQLDCMPYRSLSDTFTKLDMGIRGCLIKHIVQHVKTQPLSLPDDFVLTEDADVHDQRLMLLSKLAKLQTAADKISHIEDALSKEDVHPLMAAASSQLLLVPDAPEYHAAEQLESHSADAPIVTGATANLSHSDAHSDSTAQNNRRATNHKLPSLPPLDFARRRPASRSLYAAAFPRADEVQMQAVPQPQLSDPVPTSQDDVDSVRGKYAAALLQSAQQGAASEHSTSAASSSTPDSPASTPVPESFPAPGPSSAANSPRATASRQNSAPVGDDVTPAGYLSVSGQPGTLCVHEDDQQTIAQINADQESVAESRPASPAASESGSWLVLPTN